MMNLQEITKICL